MYLYAMVSVVAISNRDDISGHLDIVALHSIYGLEVRSLPENVLFRRRLNPFIQDALNQSVCKGLH